MPVPDRFNVCRRRPGGRRRRRPHPIDDPAKIAIRDRLAMLAERDDGPVHLIHFVRREREPERLATGVYGVTS